MTLISLLKFQTSLIPASFSLGSPFWNLKMTPPICPPTPTRVFINTPQSRGENSLLWLGRVEPSYPPSRGKLSALKKKTGSQSTSTFFSENDISSTQVSQTKLAYIIISSTFESEVLIPPWPGGHSTFLGGICGMPSSDFQSWRLRN